MKLDPKMPLFVQILRSKGWKKLGTPFPTGGFLKPNNHKDIIDF